MGISHVSVVFVVSKGMKAIRKKKKDACFVTNLDDTRKWITARSAPYAGAADGCLSYPFYFSV